MKRSIKLLFFFSLTVFFTVPTIWANGDREVLIENYIQQYKWWAMQEQIRTGVPAAIKLAQGIHETGAGKSRLAKEGNNHFGVKCRGNQWAGATISHTDDRPNECFRAYESAEGSYRDHSDFLRGNKRYASLFELDIHDYKAWARGLKAAGYATHRQYANLIIDYVEEFDLKQYTILAQDENYVLAGLQKMNQLPKQQNENIQIASVVEAEKEKPTVASINTGQAYMAIMQSEKALNEKPSALDYYELTTKNDLRGFYAKKGDLLLESAINNRIRYSRLLSLNDMQDRDLDRDMFVYLEPKHREAEVLYHEVREGEHLLEIAQAYGVQLRTLKVYNDIEDEYESLEAGRRIKLNKNFSFTEVYQEHIAQPVKEKIEEKVESKEENTKNEIQEVKEEVKQGFVKAKDKVQDVVQKGVDGAKDLVTRNKEEKETKVNEQVAINVAEKKQDGLKAMDDEWEYTYELIGVEEVKVETKDAATGLVKTSKNEKQEESEAIGKYGYPTNDLDAVQANPQKEENTPLSALDKLKAHMDQNVYGADKENKNPSSVEPVSTSKSIDTRPAGKQQVAQQTSSAKVQNGSFDKYYTVKRGDTAYSISKKFGITLKELKDWNNLSGNMSVQLGQKLRVVK